MIARLLLLLALSLVLGSGAEAAERIQETRPVFPDRSEMRPAFSLDWWTRVAQENPCAAARATVRDDVYVGFVPVGHVEACGGSLDEAVKNWNELAAELARRSAWAYRWVEQSEQSH
jgi:hypothetical protein